MNVCPDHEGDHAMSMTDRRREAEADLWGYHQNWYAVAMADDVVAGTPYGTDFLGGRIVIYRGTTGEPIVLSGICPHMGLDMALGQIMGDEIRCAQHHFTFAADGRCTSVPSGDRIPASCRLFRYPALERWGLIWAFNGTEPLYELPDRIRDYGEDDLVVRPRQFGVYNNPPWVTNSQMYDWVHLRHVHGLQFDVDPEVDFADPFHNSYDITFGVPGMGTATQLTENYGTNLVMYLTRIDGEEDSLAIFTSTPTTGEAVCQTYFCVAAPRSLPPDVIDRQLGQAEVLADQIGEEDRIAVNAMRFREGTFVRADRSLVKYLQWVRRFPKANPGEDFQ
jgi:phenylpropionate dioxygenase-like ring-hydroxylating dioxygenase large terminal subunit